MCRSIEAARRQFRPGAAGGKVINRSFKLHSLEPSGYKQYLEDFPLTEVTTIWNDTARDPENFYVVQTPSNVIRLCLLMTTDPGDLVLVFES